MRRVSGFVLTLLGAFLLLLAVLLRFWVVPDNIKIPLNTYKVTHLTGTGEYVNRGTGAQVAGVSVVDTNTTKGDVLAGNGSTAVYDVSAACRTSPTTCRFPTSPTARPSTGRARRSSAAAGSTSSTPGRAAHLGAA